MSVPASFRSYLSNLGYNGVICYPSFNNPSIEACSQDRIDKISSRKRGLLGPPHNITMALGVNDQGR